MTLKQFEKQQYLTLETFRKNGQGVKTPVWFVEDGEALLVWTQAGSGKAKRIRSDSTVRVAPSTGSGDPVGEWLPAHAQADESLETVQRLEKMMKKKYGVMFNVFGFLGKLRGGDKYTAIRSKFEVKVHHRPDRFQAITPLWRGLVETCQVSSLTKIYSRGMLAKMEDL